MDQLHTSIKTQLQKERAQSRTERSRGKLANFTVEDYVCRERIRM